MEQVGYCMNYKLAKELKDAGFPMPNRAKVWCVTKNHEEYEHDLAQATPDVDLPEDAMWIPTLSELIEACGDDFYVLRKLEKGEWVADNPRFADIDDLIGKTPEETVARLWLALQKKVVV